MERNSQPFKSEYFLEVFNKFSKIGFAYHVEQNRLVYISASAEQVLGIAADQLRSNPEAFLEIIHPDDLSYVRDSYKLGLSGQPQEIEFRILLATKQIRWLRCQYFITSEAPDRQLITGMVEDITARKDSYDTLEKFAAKKNTVLEILSHDLAGPLNNIKGLSSLLKNNLKQYQNQEVDKLVEMIASTSERSIHLIREFVKEEFLGSANSSFVKHRVNIVQKVREFMEQYKSSEQDIAKTFTYRASNEPIYMKVDDYKLGQALNNLISNAIKFTRDGGKIEVSIEEKQETILFSVSDDGIGIPIRFQEDLFDRFTKARRPGLKGEPSVGLGMSIIKIIVDWHGGEIWFKSEENIGSTFYIELPKE